MRQVRSLALVVGARGVAGCQGTTLGRGAGRRGG